MASALSLDAVSVMLGEHRALDRVSVTAAYGAITAVLGPNGAGKSTLLRVAAGLIAPAGGVCAIDGEDLAALSGVERARRIAYLPQRSALDAPLRVATVVAHGRYAHTRSGRLTGDDDRAVDRAMDATDVTGLASRSYVELSGGEQRRVLLARALATGARIIALDEPAASLDISHALALYRLLRALADDGLAVIIAMHDLNDAIAVTDRAIVLDRGRAMQTGATGDVLSGGLIEQIYGVEVASAPRLCFRLPSS